MHAASKSGSFLRWPLYEPEASAGERPALFARPFGWPEDLDVDFRSTPRPAVVTALPTRGVRTDVADIPETELWRWPVTRRTQGLLAIAADTHGTAWRTTGRCHNASCGELMEIPLDLGMFRSAAAEESFRWSAGPGEFEMRVPTGEDQMRLAAEGPLDAVAVARSLIRSGEPDLLREESLPDLEAAFSEHDPLTDIELTATCPNCGVTCQVEFDLEAFLLAELERRQMALLEAVHRLAAVYHWSEAEILALPAWRREYYLDGLAREALG